MRIAEYTSLHCPISRSRGSPATSSKSILLKRYFPQARGGLSSPLEQASKIRIIVSSRSGTVTSSDQEKVSQFSTFHSLNNLVGVRERCMMTKSDDDLVWLDILRKSAKFQCMTDDLTEIFCSIRLFRNIFYTFPSNNISTVDTILVRFAWTHETVGCHQNTAGIPSNCFC